MITSSRTIAVRAHMDPGDDDLLEAFGSQAMRFRKDAIETPGSHPPSGVGDDAVGAKLVASVLHLDKGSGVLMWSEACHLLVFMHTLVYI